MSMPSGSKFNHGYATVENGLEYRLIVERMAAEGDEISVSTARNLLLRAMEKIAYEVCKAQGMDDAQIATDAKRIALDPRFQASVACMLDDIYAQA